MKFFKHVLTRSHKEDAQVLIDFREELRSQYNPDSGQSLARMVPCLAVTIHNQGEVPLKIDFAEVYLDGKLVNANPAYWDDSLPVAAGQSLTRVYDWERLLQYHPLPSSCLQVVAYSNRYRHYRSNKLIVPA